MDCKPPGSLFMQFFRQEYWSVNCHPLLLGIFLTQGLNPGLLHRRQILYHLNYQGAGPLPKTLLICVLGNPQYNNFILYECILMSSPENQQDMYEYRDLF